MAEDVQSVFTMSSHHPEMIKGGMAIPLSEFSAYVARNHMDRDKGFELEYQATSMEGTYPMESAALPCNKAKNRFHNISPCETIYPHGKPSLTQYIPVGTIPHYIPMETISYVYK